MSTDPERQKVVHVPGSRRVKLTPAPGTTAEPVEESDAAASDPPSGGPNDDRMRQDVPPHY
ncbi:hypothetical protein GCM10009775_36310 [Microbacterium aoyamense]|uniref:Uncharacterized protein n=1 Tax=Microbacterium aoyamense TaxID=344166 RepID=A0ABN2Q4B7_9MICO|nr:hypothetical protein [Microbacterium aoyamense]